MKSVRGLYNKGKEWGLSKAVGKKEKDLDEFLVQCVDCGTAIDIDDTNCPRKIRKLIKRNMKTRSIAALTFHKFNARCPRCHDHFMSTSTDEDESFITKEEAFDRAQEAVDEYKKKNKD